MPLPCFRYYVTAYTKYLLSKSSHEDSDGASCFFGIVETRKEDIKTLDQPVVSEIIKTLHRLRENQDWYDASEEIYGRFDQNALKCLGLIEAEQGTG